MATNGKFYISIYTNGIFIAFDGNIYFSKAIRFNRLRRRKIIKFVEETLSELPSHAYEIYTYDNLSVKESAHYDEFEQVS